MTTAIVIKETGKMQRSDVQLTKELAGSLVQMIFDGKNLFSTEGYITIPQEGGEGMRLSCNTLKNWITRENVIPETGHTLRKVLDQARKDYRALKREELQESMLNESEKVLKRALSIQTNLVQRTMFGQEIKREDGTLVRKESANLLRIKVDAAKYVTERLDSARYGKVEKTENKHLIFSLADLRKAKEGKTE